MFMKFSDRDAFGRLNKYRSALLAGLTNPILGFAPILLLDGDTLSGSNDDTVGLWNDISGNTNHAAQTTESQKALLKTGGNGINGHSCIYADGADDNYVILFDNSIYTEMTWVAVYKADHTDAYNRIFSIRGGSGAWTFGNGNTAINNISSTYTADTTDTHILIADFKENSGYNVWRDTVSVGSGALGSLGWWTDVDGGINLLADYGTSPNGTRNWHGKIAYIAVFPTQLSEADRAEVYNYLAARYIA